MERSTSNPVLIHPQKYYDALQYEDADAVLGSVMSALQFPTINGIVDACDYEFNMITRPQDLKLIHQKQPMFFNVAEHRLVNKADVVKVIQKFSAQ